MAGGTRRRWRAPHGVNGGFLATGEIALPQRLPLTHFSPALFAGNDDLEAPLQNRVVVPAVSKVPKRMRESAATPRRRPALLKTVVATNLARLGSDGVLRKKIWEITDFSSESFFDNIADAARSGHGPERTRN